MNTVKNHASRVSSPNACTDWTTPERVRNVPKMVRKNVEDDQRHVPDLQHAPLFLDHALECRNAVAVNHGSRPAFSTGSQTQSPPQPSSS